MTTPDGSSGSKSAANSGQHNSQGFSDSKSVPSSGSSDTAPVDGASGHKTVVNSIQHGPLVSIASKPAPNSSPKVDKSTASNQGTPATSSGSAGSGANKSGSGGKLLGDSFGVPFKSTPQSASGSASLSNKHSVYALSGSLGPGQLTPIQTNSSKSGSMGLADQASSSLHSIRLNSTGSSSGVNVIRAYDPNCSHCKHIDRTYGPFAFLDTPTPIKWSHHPLALQFASIIREYLNRTGYRDGVRITELMNPNGSYGRAAGLNSGSAFPQVKMPQRDVCASNHYSNITEEHRTNSNGSGGP